MYFLTPRGADKSPKIKPTSFLRKEVVVTMVLSKRKRTRHNTQKYSTNMLTQKPGAVISHLEFDPFLAVEWRALNRLKRSSSIRIQWFHLVRYTTPLVEYAQPCLVSLAYVGHCHLNLLLMSGVRDYVVEVFTGPTPNPTCIKSFSKTSIVMDEMIIRPDPERTCKKKRRPFNTCHWSCNSHLE